MSPLIVVWGANPSVSGLHLVPLIRDAQRRGATLVVVDPRTTWPLDKETLVESAKKTSRAIVIDEGYERYGVTAEIASVIKAVGGMVVMTSSDCRCGTERVGEALAKLDPERRHDARNRRPVARRRPVPREGFDEAERR